MNLFEDAVLLRILIGESDRWKHQPLHEAIVMKAREMEKLTWHQWCGGAFILVGAIVLAIE